MPDAAHIDFETRSTCDLKKHGIDVYSRDPNTAIWCLGWCIGDQDVNLWTPAQSDPTELLDHVENGHITVAHNVLFELLIWNRLCVAWGWPKLRFSQTECTMLMAHTMALPGALDDACAAMGLDMQKDMKGHRLMLQMAKPRKIHPNGRIEWWDVPEKKERLGEYCKQDVRAERELHKRLRPLSKGEVTVRELDARINFRGVQVDVPAARAIGDMIEGEKERLNTSMEKATGGMVKKTSWTGVLTDWVRAQGVATPGVAKDAVLSLLDDPSTPKHVCTALQLRQRAAKTSTAKIDKLLHLMGPDEVVRFILQQNGAATGRWAARGVQLHNLPRGNLKPHEVEDCLAHFMDGDRDAIELLYGDILDVASSCLRGLFVARPGCVFQAADYSNIEGRKLAWLAGEEWKLEAFREADAGTGPEIYKATAGMILGKPADAITKAERNSLGKVSELSLGYGGGVGAYVSMGRVYGVNMADNYDTVLEAMPESVIERALDAWHQRGEESGLDRPQWLASEMVKVAWRDKHPATVQFWYDLEDAAINAVDSPGDVFYAGAQPIAWRKSGSFLFCRLPSGRVNTYAYPRIELVKTPWGAKKRSLVYKSKDPITGKWVDTSTFGGKIAENVTQASAACNLRYSMLRVERSGRPIVLHVHDELVTEVRVDNKRPLAELEAEMAILPAWAKGLPIKAEGWEARRFRKD